MTEYDYSPAAYERYLAQQARVSNWVSDTLQQSHAYSNPFVLSPTLRDRTFYDGPEDHRTPHHDQWSNGSSRPSRSRSKSHVDHAYYDRAAPASRYRSQSHSRSAPTPRDVQVIYPHGTQPYVYPQTHAIDRTPAPRNHHYASPPSRQAYVTQPPPGQIYHLPVNPPAPKESLYRQPSHTRHTSSKGQSYLLVPGGGPKAEYKRGVRPFLSALRAC